jgi:hypothetical protein
VRLVIGPEGRGRGRAPTPAVGGGEPRLRAAGYGESIPHAAAPANGQRRPLMPTRYISTEEFFPFQPHLYGASSDTTVYLTFFLTSETSCYYYRLKFTFVLLAPSAPIHQ